MKMSEQPLISVIVPVYKVEAYLHRCVDSILTQTYQNLEILLVDDGSPDNCGAVCDDYAKRDARVRVIHKKNGGQADARNAALAVMKGQYVTFVDSDDWVTVYYIENLYRALEGKADMAVSWFANVFSADTIPAQAGRELQSLLVLSSHDCMERLLYQDGVETAPWGKLYHRNLICDLQYPVGKIYEDIPVTVETIIRAEKIALIQNVDYYYFQRPESTQNEAFHVRKMDIVPHLDELMTKVKKQFPDLEKACKCRCLSGLCNVMFQIKGDGYETERIQLWNRVKQYRKDVLLNHKARKKARLAALLSYFGYRIMKFVYAQTQWRG